MAALFMALAWSGCKDPYPASGASASEPAAAPAREDPTRLDLGNTPIRNPLNLYDMGIEGAPDFQTAGAIDGVAITMRDLEAQSVGAFSRIAERVYQAQDHGYRWLIERAALDQQAAAAGRPLMPFLLERYGKLPRPDRADLDRVLAEIPLSPSSGEERDHTATSLWRLAAWEQARHELILEGRASIRFERLRQQISSPEYARPETVVARLDDQPITRADLRVFSGYQAELARHEYWRIASMQFDKYVSRFLREREAQHLGITGQELVDLEIAGMAEATDADVRAFIEENPEYERDPEGHARARDNLRRLRGIRAEEQLDARLRGAADVRFYLIEPDLVRVRIEVPAPRWHGPLEAEHVLVAFHSLGCDTCARGSQLLLSVLEAWKTRPGRIKLLAGDYFEPGRLASYRGALALHCAPPQWRDALLKALVADFGTGEIAALAARAAAVGMDAQALRACLEKDAFLPLIVENLAMARRLGLERNVPGLFADGMRIGDLKDLDRVLEQIDQALPSVEP
jgi:hypothetical protein